MESLHGLSVTELSRALGKSRQAVYVALRVGRISRLPNGKFDLAQTRDDWRNHTHPGKGVVRPRPSSEAEEPVEEDAPLRRDLPDIRRLCDFYFDLRQFYLVPMGETLLHFGMPEKNVASALCEFAVGEIGVVADMLGLEGEPWIQGNHEVFQQLKDKKGLLDAILAFHGELDGV